MKNSKTSNNHLSKRTLVVKAGFQTGTHALPPEVKEEVDKMPSYADLKKRLSGVYTCLVDFVRKLELQNRVRRVY